MVPISDEEFELLSNYIRKNYGLNLKIEKKYLVQGRLSKLLAEKNISSFSEYYQYILSDRTNSSMVDLVDRLTTNHTYFLRENEHFDYFKNGVLPYLVSTLQTDKDLRIWSAGCSTGEEPYTIAMILQDYFGGQKNQWDSKILATDISSHVLELAKKGQYVAEQIAALPAKWKKDYFVEVEHNKYQIIDRIKSEVIFRKFNLVSEVFPFKKKFHIIYCRNVMIYFDSIGKNSLVERFYEATEPGGYLFIGHSESLDRNQFRYKYIRPAVYRKE